MNGVNSDAHSFTRIQNSTISNTFKKLHWAGNECESYLNKNRTVRCRLRQVRCQSTERTVSCLSQYGCWFVLALIAFTDSITGTISKTWLSDNPALEMCFLNLFQARFFPTEAIVCLGQRVGTPWHQSEWLLFLGYLKSRDLNTISTVVAYLLSLLSQIYQ